MEMMLYQSKHDAADQLFVCMHVNAAIEIEIHDGPYNLIQNWNYTGMVEALCNGNVSENDLGWFHLLCVVVCNVDAVERDP